MMPLSIMDDENLAWKCGCLNGLVFIFIALLLITIYLGRQHQLGKIDMKSLINIKVFAAVGMAICAATFAGGISLLNQWRGLNKYRIGLKAQGHSEEEINIAVQSLAASANGDISFMDMFSGKVLPAFLVKNQSLPVAH